MREEFLAVLLSFLHFMNIFCSSNSKNVQPFKTEFNNLKNVHQIKEEETEFLASSGRSGGLCLFWKNPVDIQLKSLKNVHQL